MKIAFGMIVFNGDFVLQQCLEQIYPFASQILIAEGPVEYWRDKGHVISSDNTNRILYDFPDPEGKIKIVHGPYGEKDEQCNAYMKFLNDDTDYLWQIDSDEVYKTEDIENIIEFLQEDLPDSVGVKPYSFFGGFDYYISGFEEATDNFLRIFRVFPGSRWITHRSPTMGHKPEYRQYPNVHVTSDELYTLHGVRMYHYSYVFPTQVQAKMSYYESKVARNKIIPNYFARVWLPWATSSIQSEKSFIEGLNCGVHEFKPEFRGDAYPLPYAASYGHPEAIERDKEKLKARLEEELKVYV